MRDGAWRGLKFNISVKVKIVSSRTLITEQTNICISWAPDGAKKVEAELAAKNINLLEILIELNLFSFYGH